MPPAARPDLLVETDGPVRRLLSARGGMITYAHLAGLTGTRLDEFIARQRDHFTGLGRPVDWVTHAHDEPADLPGRLMAAGFAESETGTILAGRSADLATPVPAPAGAELREVSTRKDFQRIADMQGTVWGVDAAWLVPQLAGQQAAEPDRWTFLVAEAAGEVVAAGWTRHLPGRFAMLYGGATLPGWQGRGIYRALVAARAQRALARGHEFLVVDASASSRPILQRLGLTPLTTRVSYRWKPPVADQRRDRPDGRPATSTGSTTTTAPTSPHARYPVGDAGWWWMA